MLKVILTVSSPLCSTVHMLYYISQMYFLNNTCMLVGGKRRITVPPLMGYMFPESY